MSPEDKLQKLINNEHRLLPHQLDYVRKTDVTNLCKLDVYFIGNIYREIFGGPEDGRETI